MIMDQTVTYLPYESTGYFSKIVSDYLSQAPALRPFYQHTPDLNGIKAAIAARQQFATPRPLLAETLAEQYENIALSEKVKTNLSLLTKENTFTITTAHQPNIFTGPLYFIYKILHAIRLADELAQQLPAYHFVPVYYMGSEDADLDELGYVNVGGQKLVWETKQTGAVGRMKVDKQLIKLIHAIHGQAGVWPFGNEFTDLLKQSYTEGKTIQQATLEMVNALFGKYGLVILIPDHAKLKTAFSSVVTKELTERFSHEIVSGTIEALEKNYKVQAGGREINLFYLLDDKRERIEPAINGYEVKTLGLTFTREEILNELKTYPGRFSANVILRGAFQETILPNIAFIGGGGELAYWLELKEVFAAVAIPYPVLLLRNSFLVMKEEQAGKCKALGFSDTDLFQDELTLLNTLVKKSSAHQLTLTAELQEAKQYYARLRSITDSVDKTLSEHLLALEKQALKKLTALETKLLRAERRKYEAQQRQIAQIKQELFPANSLQERTDNLALYYAKSGSSFLDNLYQASTPFNAGFGLIITP